MSRVWMPIPCLGLPSASSGDESGTPTAPKERHIISPARKCWEPGSSIRVRNDGANFAPIRGEQQSHTNMRTVSPEVRPINPRPLLIQTLIVFCPSPGFAQAPPAQKSPIYRNPLPQHPAPAGLKQELRKLQTTGRLMMVVAHPD